MDIVVTLVVLSSRTEFGCVIEKSSRQSVGVLEKKTGSQNTSKVAGVNNYMRKNRNLLYRLVLTPVSEGFPVGRIKGYGLQV